MRYYDAIAEWALPCLHARPLALVRASDGIAGELFFRKHTERARIPGIEELRVSVYIRDTNRCWSLTPPTDWSDSLR